MLQRFRIFKSYLETPFGVQWILTSYHPCIISKEVGRDISKGKKQTKSNNIQKYTKKFQTNFTTRHFSGFQICRGKKYRDQFVRFQIIHQIIPYPISKFLLPKMSCLHIRQKIASGAKMFPQNGQTSAQQRVEKFSGSQNHTTPGTPVMSRWYD